MRRPLPLAWGVVGLLLACDSGSGTPEPEPTPVWPEPVSDDADATPEPVAHADLGTLAPVAQDDAGAQEPGPYIPLVDRTVSLKERFQPGERLHREIRLERSYRVSVQSGRAASAEGGTELTRSYTVNVRDAIGGQIIGATVTIDSDGVRVLPGVEEWPRLAPSRGSLEGVHFDCQLNPDRGFDCELPIRDGHPIDVEGVIPQRPGVDPGRPAVVGDTWQLTGVDARNFLGIEGADATVDLAFDDGEAAWQGQACHHVTYTFQGSQPLRLSGRTLTAELSGHGELYHCRHPNAVVYHRQQRDVTASGPRRPGGGPAVERVEHIVFEERTTVEEPAPTVP